MFHLYVDSADPEQVARWLATGLAHGVTSNPSILARAGLSSADIPAFLARTLDAGAKKVLVQTWGRSAAEMADRGEEFRTLSPDVTIKVPSSQAGIEAALALAPGGDVVATAIFSAAQIAPILGTPITFVSPYIGHIYDGGQDAMAEVDEMQSAITRTASTVEIFAGSLRSPQQVIGLAARGVKHVAAGPAVWEQLFGEERTAAAEKRFLEAAEAT